MSASREEDTEITLGTGKILALFLGLVALCAVFFALGFKLGKGSGNSVALSAEPGSAIATAGGGRPSATKPATPAPTAPDVAFYKANSQKTGETPAAGTESATPDSQVAASSAPPPSGSGYYVQVAAVSRQEDGDALVDALKKKEYAAFSTTGPDKLFHVEVGPFSDVKSAEETRARLINDGYNPILKK